MRFDILTIFPDMFKSYFSHSLMARAQKKKLINIVAHDLRDFTTDKHKTVDDRPYGGGVGMVMKVDVVDRALRDLNSKFKIQKAKVILVTPQGKVFNQKLAKKLAKYDRLIFISGRYEGYDERIRKMVDEEISIGDYVLTGGELPVMVIIDTVARLQPGVVGKEQSLEEESFTPHLLDGERAKSRDTRKKSAGFSSLFLEYPHYTRPEEFRGRKVPKVLLSGNHAKIKEWRREQSIKRTKKRRPDLLK